VNAASTNRNALSHSRPRMQFRKRGKNLTRGFPLCTGFDDSALPMVSWDGQAQVQRAEKPNFLWACKGTLIVVFWTIHIAATPGNRPGTDGVGWVLVCLTCPIAFAGKHPLSFYLVPVVNAATFALVAAGVETTREHCHFHSISS